MCSMPWQQVSILNENKEKTPQLQYESDVFSCHGRGNPAPSNFRLDAHAHKLGRILLYEFAVPFRPLVAGGIVRHENNVAVLIHLFLPPSVPLFPGIVACLAEPLQVSRMDCPFSRERSHCGQTFFQRRRIRLGFGTRDPLAGYLVLQSRGLYRDMKKASLRKLFDGADNGTRTRGLNLGKVALYQLSYVRKLFPPWWATSRKYT